MGRYYAKIVESDYFDFEYYYNDDDARCDNICITGNSHLREINEDLVNGFESIFSDIFNDISYEEDKVGDEGLDISILREIVTQYFPERVSKKPYSDEEIREICEMVSDWNNVSKSYWTDFWAKALEFIYEEPFDCRQITGCCQSDWQEIIFPVSRKDSIPYIEAVYFRTGTELEVTDSKIENKDEFYKAHKDGQTNWTYTEEYSDDGIKKYVASCIGCSVDEVVLLKTKTRRTIVEIEYEEV